MRETPIKATNLPKVFYQTAQSSQENITTTIVHPKENIIVTVSPPKENIIVTIDDKQDKTTLNMNK